MLFFKKSHNTKKNSEKIDCWSYFFDRKHLQYLTFIWDLPRISSSGEYEKWLALDLKIFRFCDILPVIVTCFWSKNLDDWLKILKVLNPDFLHLTLSSDIGLNLLRNLRVIKSGFGTSETIHWAYMLCLYKNCRGDFSRTKPKMYSFYIF